MCKGGRREEDTWIQGGFLNAAATGQAFSEAEVVG